MSIIDDGASDHEILELLRLGCANGENAGDDSGAVAVYGVGSSCVPVTMVRWPVGDSTTGSFTMKGPIRLPFSSMVMATALIQFFLVVTVSNNRFGPRSGNTPGFDLAKLQGNLESSVRTALTSQSHLPSDIGHFHLLTTNSSRTLTTS